jgi:hypothetical protein
MGTETEWLDIKGVVINLVPKAFTMLAEDIYNNALMIADPGGLCSEQLAEWYRTYGFVDLPTSHNDVDCQNDMVRYPA